VTADLPIEATIDAQHATFRVTPPHGRPVTFEVALRRVDVTRSHSGYYQTRFADRYVVQMLGSWGSGFGTFTSFDAAVRSCLHRARRYARAYSVERAA